MHTYKCFSNPGEVFQMIFKLILFCILKGYNLEPLDTFRTEQKLKVHRFTNNLQGLQKVVVKDFSWNISPWNALLFEKTLKQYKFLISRFTDLF